MTFFSLRSHFKWLFWITPFTSILGAPIEEGVLYSSFPCAPSTYAFSLDTTLLYWQAREDGLNFAFENSPNSVQANTNVDGKFTQVDFKWEPAFKLKLGAEFPKRAWDFLIQWTYFHTNTTTTKESAQGFLPLWAFPKGTGVQTSFQEASSHWNLNFDTFDIEMGYAPKLSPFFSLRLIAGLKMLIIDQNYDVYYQNPTISEETKMTNNMVGAGSRIGFSSKWSINKGFSFITSMVGALPLWHYKVSRIDVDQNQEQTTNSFSKGRFWTFRPVIETLIGFSWDTCLGSKCQYPFGVSARYEFQYFLESNMLEMLVNPGITSLVYLPRGDLQMQGASLNFHFGF